MTHGNTTDDDDDDDVHQCLYKEKQGKYMAIDFERFRSFFPNADADKLKTSSILNMVYLLKTDVRGDDTEMGVYIRQNMHAKNLVMVAHNMELRGQDFATRGNRSALSVLSMDNECTPG